VQTVVLPRGKKPVKVTVALNDRALPQQTYKTFAFNLETKMGDPLESLVEVDDGWTRRRWPPLRIPGRA
jgi:hypothetical protein